MFPRALYSRLPLHRPRPSSSSFVLSASFFASLFHIQPAASMSVKELVDSAIAENKIAIFSKSWCPYSKKAKALFAEEFPQVQTTIFELDERDDGSAIQEYLLKVSGQRTVPNIFVNGQHVGGSDDVRASFNQGKLAQLVNA
ncbi:Glutaredoxin-C4 [Hypsizygus marmoreus]|uniref:glutathione peroxidase n=1 Tax=Hypsizygus marmoreus TaxID=39966 RepID=A0A369J7C9_HYPMA|nr:Glutaredoxin-C4 [Hypsizygus marmoreus]